MKLIITLLAILFLQYCSAQKYSESDFYSTAALKTEREKFLEQTINNTIHKNLIKPLSDSTESDYISAFWAMQLTQYRDEFTDKAVRECINDFFNRSTEFQRAVLEVIYSLYQSEFNEEILSLMPKLNNAKLFAMSVYYLKSSVDAKVLNELTNQFEMKFMSASENPILKMLKFDLQTEFRKNLTTPPLIDFLKNNFGENSLVIFSLQRLNRDYPGLLLIKKPDGKFLRDNSGKIFSVPQLARAISDLPGYITNGNTPEGILSIQGKDVSKNIFIGPTPNLQLVLPFEVPVNIYFHNNRNETNWDVNLYSGLLPDSWKEYTPIYEAYFAGKAGRNEIIAHGTTIDFNFYKDKSYYPFTPSQGCLTTKEIWSAETGLLIESDQMKLMNELMQLNFDKGYFIVVNIDDKQTPVELNELEEIIESAER